jgi:hypothetical protein
MFILIRSGPGARHRDGLGSLSDQHRDIRMKERAAPQDVVVVTATLGRAGKARQVQEIRTDRD